jgi:hypothetical protein
MHTHTLWGRYLALCNIVPALVQTNHVSMLDAITQVAFGLCIQACVIAVMVHAFNSWSTSRVSLARFNESLQCAGICAGVWLMVVMLQVHFLFLYIVIFI